MSLQLNGRPVKVLVVDDEAAIREILVASLKDEGFEAHSAHDGLSGLKAMQEFHPDIVFLDIWMPGNMDGLQLLTRAKETLSHTQYVMISGHGTIETAVKSTKLGAFDFVEKPLSMDKIQIIISNIVNYMQEKDEKNAFLNKLRKNLSLIGDSENLAQVRHLIARTAPTQSWILVSGENGVGKELVAQNIHYLSHRASRPFVDINCSQIPEDLLEGEIFGFEKGSLPGLEKTRFGRLDMASGGTLYMQDIAAMNQPVQMRLLRYLQEKKYHRVGGTELIDNDVRVIAGNSADLEKEVLAGNFREDLLYRLNLISINVPPLRERKQDVSILVQHFSEIFARESGYPKKTFSETALEQLRSHAWPGNIRELRNFVERVYILTPGEFVDLHDVRFAGLIEKEIAATVVDDGISNFRDARAKFEREYLIKKIQDNNGNITKTAEMIGLERSYLHRKIKAYGIEVT